MVGSAWVGIAAGLGHAQGVVWLIAFGTFYVPMATAVFYLNLALPLEGGLYAWARSAFGDTAGFLVAWNIWGYGLTTIATVLFQIPSEFAFMVGPDAAWIAESHGVVLSFLAVVLLLLALSAVQGLALGKWIHNVSSTAMLSAFAMLILAPLWAWLRHVPIHFAPFDLKLPDPTPTSVALIGQTLFASAGLEYVAIMAARLVILLLQIRIRGATSFIFTGVTRLHPRYRTPTNSILVAAVLVGLLVVLASVGVQSLRDRIPHWVAVPNPLNFAVKLIATTALINALGSNTLGESHLRR